MSQPTPEAPEAPGHLFAGRPGRLGRLIQVVATVLILQAAPSQGIVWRWSNPLPHGNNIVDMAWDGQTAVQVAELGQIYTGVGFYGWLPRDSGTTNTLQAVRFFGNRIVFVGANGTAGYSDDGVNFAVKSLNTSDWLVDLAVSPNQVVAVGDNAVIFSSSDGAHWSFSAVAPNAGQNWLLSVAWGAGMFVATGEGGYVATSPDGANWTSRDSGVTDDLTRVLWVGGTGSSSLFPFSGFWAVTGDGRALYSTDRGTSWQLYNVNASSNVLYTLAANGDTGLLAGDGQVRLGTTANRWSEQTSPIETTSPAPLWTYYSALWDETNNEYRLAGDNGMMVEGTATNRDYLWSEQYPSPRDWLWQVTATEDLYVAVGDNARIMTSQNGVDWTVEAVPLTNSIAGPGTNTVFLCVGGDTNLLLAAGNHGSLVVSPATLEPVVLTNLDGTIFTNYINAQGLVWYAQPAPASEDFSAVCSFAGQYVLAGGNGTILLSPDGTNWTQANVPTTNYLSGLAASSNLVVATGDQGVVLTSADGQNWTKRASGTTNWIFRVRWMDGVFLAVGESGTLLRSTNGTSWTAVNSGTANWLNDAVLVSNKCFVVGTAGTVLSSTNFVAWNNIGTITRRSLYGAASRNGQLVNVGVRGSILRSQIIPNPNPIQFISYNRAGGDNVFAVVGAPDQRFTLDSSNDLTNWTAGPTLELFYGSGSLVFVIPAGTNDPPARFFRATVVP